MASLEKEKRILRAAEKLFTTRRFHEVRLDDVAAIAHVGKGTIYRYFKNKDDLFLRVVMSGYDELCALIRRTASQTAPFEAQLRRILLDINRFHMRKRALFRLLHSHPPRMSFTRGSMRGQWKKHSDAVHAQLAAWLRRGAKEGFIRKELPPETIAACLMGMARGYLMQVHQKGRKAPPLDNMVDLFLRGASANGKKSA